MSSDLKRRGGGLESQTQTSHTDQQRDIDIEFYKTIGQDIPS